LVYFLVVEYAFGVAFWLHEELLVDVAQKIQAQGVQHVQRPGALLWSRLVLELSAAPGWWQSQPARAAWQRVRPHPWYPR
jgi:hypothetical protein